MAAKFVDKYTHRSQGQPAGGSMLGESRRAQCRCAELMPVQRLGQAAEQQIGRVRIGR
jgi:hypothetical protein